MVYSWDKANIEEEAIAPAVGRQRLFSPAIAQNARLMS